MNQLHQSDDLIRIFNACFESRHRTKLIKGGDEPLYQPAEDGESFHAIYFAHGFFSSALHECAHWFIAGPERRLEVDYGYWYAPDGRTSEQQRLFQQVEVKPQALEWILSDAACHRFHVSVDNLNGDAHDTDAFLSAVRQQKEYYQRHGLPKRAEIFREALSAFYCSMRTSRLFEK